MLSGLTIVPIDVLTVPKPGNKSSPDRNAQVNFSLSANKRGQEDVTMPALLTPHTQQRLELVAHGERRLSDALAAFLSFLWLRAFPFWSSAHVFMLEWGCTKLYHCDIGTTWRLLNFQSESLTAIGLAVGSSFKLR